MKVRKLKKLLVHNAAKLRQRYPAPLSAHDLCDCGRERLEHEGKHGWGPCLMNGCPRFEDSGV